MVAEICTGVVSFPVFHFGHYGPHTTRTQYSSDEFSPLLTPKVPMVVKRGPILGSKEDTNFNEALKLYDAKQYKKALKLVDQNLKKNSNHAESLTLKGCLNYFLNNKTEAEAYIVKGTSKEPNNYIVNNLAGIYYRMIENYPDAAKWLKAAVDNGSPNKQILRDLSLIQTQIRDYKNLKDSRQMYLENQSGYRANWTALAVAYYLNKNYSKSITTLANIEDIIKKHLTDSDMYEHSECVLFKNDCLFHNGQIEKALQDLETDFDYIKDKLSYMEYKARYLLILGKNEEASTMYRKLLQRNPDNVFYYKQLEICLKIMEKPLSSRIKLYDNLAKFYPKADAPKFLPLTFIPSTNELFRSKVETYILHQLQKGIPATFVNIKPILKNSKKSDIILDVVTKFYENEVDKLIPTVKVWTLFFLSQFSLYKKDLIKANLYIDQALTHSPTLVELYIMKARIVKHFGNLKEASEIMEQGRLLDLQDRFINSKACKYYLRANDIEKAVDLISLFTKLDDKAINGCKDLHLMQANWFLTESAEAYKRLYHQYEQELETIDQSNPENEDLVNDLKEKIDINKGLSLKRFTAVVNIFKIFFNDQFDFHSYCMRRGTPRHYVETIKWEDELRGTPIYVRVIKGLADIYFEIYEQQKLKANGTTNEPEGGVKKNNKKNKKAKAQVLKQKESLVAKVESEKEDKDPLGTKILSDLFNNSDGDIIDNLYKLAQPLFTEAKDYQVTWELSFKLNLLKSKYVLCLQAIKSLNNILNPDNNKKINTIEQMISQLDQAVKTDENANDAIKKVIEKGLSTSFPQYV